MRSWQPTAPLPATATPASCAGCPINPYSSGRCFRLSRRGSSGVSSPGEAQPAGNGSVPDVVPLARKTGTSYGYRDARSVGINPRYLIGVWVGRPDATPVAGQFGFASAVPVMNQINSLLMSRLGRRDVPGDPRPASVTVASICWHGGQPLPAGDENCRQRRQSWVAADTLPPTLLAPGRESLSGLRQGYWQNAQGLRVAADCPGATRHERLVWPLPLEARLPPQGGRRNACLLLMPGVRRYSRAAARR